jgi:hypothetical protein
MDLVLKISKYRTADGRDLRKGDRFSVGESLGHFLIARGKAAVAPEPAARVALPSRQSYRTRRLTAED